MRGLAHNVPRNSVEKICSCRKKHYTSPPALQGTDDIGPLPITGFTAMIG